MTGHLVDLNLVDNKVPVVEPLSRAATVTAQGALEHSTNVSTKDNPRGDVAPCTLYFDRSLQRRNCIASIFHRRRRLPLTKVGPKILVPFFIHAQRPRNLHLHRRSHFHMLIKYSLFWCPGIHYIK